MSIEKFFRTWWKWLRYSPDDPRFNFDGNIRIVVIGGGTGLANLLRGLKKFSNNITAIVTVTDNGSSTGKLRKEFDMVAPGDIRKCISALAYDEDLFSKLFEHRFAKSKKTLGGHTLGNIWLTALTDYFGSFDRAVEATSEIFQTAGKVLPSTLDNTNICIDYKDGTTLKGEENLDEVLKEVDKIYFEKKSVRVYKKASEAIINADMIIIGPGSLYGSLIPNLIINGISKAIIANKIAVKIYVANCSTERTQTANYSIDDHINAIHDHINRKRLFDFCLVNDRIIKRSKDQKKLGEVNNISTSKKEISGVRIVARDVVSEKQPLFHDSDKLAKNLIELYNKEKK